MAQLDRLRAGRAEKISEGFLGQAARETKGNNREKAMAQLRQDFHGGYIELQRWSALYHRFLSPFSFSTSEIVSTTDVNDRAFRHRVQDGTTYLTDYLRRAEANAHAAATNQNFESERAEFIHPPLPAMETPSGIYYDDFSDYEPGAPPAGWFLRGYTKVMPVIEEIGGDKGGCVVSFPEVPWQYWDSWLIRDNLVLSSAYAITVKLNFQNEVADRAGLTFAWNVVNSDHIDVQPNIYWKHIEVHVKYGGPAPSNVVVASAKRIAIEALTDYWLKVVASDFGPGLGQVQVYWSEDGEAFEQALIVTGLPNLTGLAGLSTAGPHLPHTHFSEFRAEWR